MTWSLTLAGLPRVGAKSKPHDYKQKYKKEGPSENEFHEKTVSAIQTKKSSTFIA